MSFALHSGAGIQSLSPCNTGVGWGVFLVRNVVIWRSRAGVVNGRRRKVSVTCSESRSCPYVRRCIMAWSPESSHELERTDR